MKGWLLAAKLFQHSDVKRNSRKKKQLTTVNFAT